VLHPTEEAHIGVGRAHGAYVETLDGALALVHPAPAMRSFNCLSCWSPAALPQLMSHAISFYQARRRPPVIALTDRLPPAAHAMLIEAGWQASAPRQLFMERTGPGPGARADLTIRPLSPALIAPFAALIAESFGWSAALQAQQHPLYENLLARRRGLHYVALIDDMVVGTASIEPAVAPHETHWGLYKVTTHAAFRGQGIATTLVTRALQDAAAAGARNVFLYTNPDGAAVSIYERMGFAPLFCRTLYIWP
jgi:ribosomal protein S18 acetylase RimI-like enzyme